MRRLLAGLVVALAGCQASVPEVVVYCALDREFAEPILKRFERETGVRVRAKYDSESTKSVGLAELLLRERREPRCDLFWNNELLQTLRLESEGLLTPYEPSESRFFPAEYRSASKRWHGFAARVRVLLVNTSKVKKEETPRTYEDLLQVKWKGKVGMAKPLFGTTATQLAFMAAGLGEEWTRAWLAGLKRNDVAVLSGNKQVASAVGAGSLALGLTDTDDALAEVRAGRPVEIVYLESEAEGRGVLLLPNTVAMIEHGPHPEQVGRLMDFLLTKEVEEELSRGPSGQIPLHEKATAGPELRWPSTAKRFKVEPIERLAEVWEKTKQVVMEELLTP